MSSDIASRTASGLARKAADHLAETLRSVIFASAHGHAQVAYVPLSSSPAKNVGSGIRAGRDIIHPRSR